MIHPRGLSLPYACAHASPNKNFNKHLKQKLKQVNSCLWLPVSKVMRVREIATLNKEVKKGNLIRAKAPFCLSASKIHIFDHFCKRMQLEQISSILTLILRCWSRQYLCSQLCLAPS